MGQTWRPTSERVGDIAHSKTRAVEDEPWIRQPVGAGDRAAGGERTANKVIADVLDVSLWTVGTHLRRIITKLGVNSRAEMVAHVLGGGLLDR